MSRTTKLKSNQWSQHENKCSLGLFPSSLYKRSFLFFFRRYLDLVQSRLPAGGPRRRQRAREGGREGEEGREGRRAGGGGCGGQGFPPWAGGGCPASGAVRSGETGNGGFPRWDWTKPKVPSLGAVGGGGLCLRSWQERR